MDEMDLDDIQSEVETWLQWNYSPLLNWEVSPQHHDTFASLAAIVEECGELVEAVTDTTIRDVKALKELEDAVGDIMIACIAYCSNEQLNVSEIFADRGDKKIESNPANLLITLSRLSRATLKGKVQYPMRHDEYQRKAIKALKDIFLWLEFTIPADSIIELTYNSWQDVRCRVYGPNHGTIEPYKWRT